MSHDMAYLAGGPDSSSPAPGGEGWHAQHREAKTGILKPFRTAWVIFTNYRHDNGPLVAAAASFYAMASFIPLVLLGVSGLGYYLGTEQAMQRVLEQVDQYAPPLLAETFRKGIPGVVEARGTLGIVAMLTLFWSASEAFTMLERGVNLMWGAQKRRWWHARLLGAGLVLLTGVSGLVITSLATLSVWFGRQQILGHPLTSAERLTKHIAGISPFVLAVIICAVIYDVLPNTRVDRRAALAGGLVAGALFYLVVVAFRTVLLTARFHVLYGPLAGVVAALFCVYYCNAVLLLGAETAEYVTERYAARERVAHPSEDTPEPA